MNLFNYYNKPAELYRYEDAYNKMHELIKEVWHDGLNAQQEKVIAKDPNLAYHYASEVLRGEWPPGEKAIASDPYWALEYASGVVDGRWPLGEKAIAKDPYRANHYATFIIKGKWPEGEKAIATDAYYKAKYNEMLKDNGYDENEFI